MFDPSGATLACAGCQPKGGAFVQGTPLALFFDWPTGKVRQPWKISIAEDVHRVAVAPMGWKYLVERLQRLGCQLHECSSALD